MLRLCQYQLRRQLPKLRGLLCHLSFQLLDLTRRQCLRPRCFVSHSLTPSLQHRDL